MTAEEARALRGQIQTIAFCAYIMQKDHLDQPTAMRKMGELCALTQMALGLGEELFPEVRFRDGGGKDGQL
jgi:hypothetical protein